MKQKILLGVLITSIFFTLFPFNVLASDVTVVDNEHDSAPIETIYNNYFVYQIENTGTYYVRANVSWYENGVFNITKDYIYNCEYAGGYNNIDEVIDALINGTLSQTTFEYKFGTYELSFVKASSHDMYNSDGTLVFQQSPLTISTQVIMTVGKMTPQQIVQETMKQKVYLLPFLIVSVVGFLAFRKGLAMLFRTLAKA